MKIRQKVGIGLLLVWSGFYLLNASWIAGPPEGEMTLLSHRGVHQTYPKEGLKNDTCTASRIYPPSHSYIENTIEAFQAAIDYGATMFELDVHPTTDGEFVVFHDWTLDCRTEGLGKTRNHDLAYLQSLDIGFGYTSDDGQTYPLRGQTIPMPTLKDVLAAFPETPIMINIKSRSKSEASALLEYVPEADWSRLSVLGHHAPLSVVSAGQPNVKTITKRQTKTCAKNYVLLGWSGYVPKACRNVIVPVPTNYQWVIWGWPHRFEKRLQKYGSRSMLVGPYTGGPTLGVDTPQDIKMIPENYRGIIWTNRIETIAPALNP